MRDPRVSVASQLDGAAPRALQRAARYLNAAFPDKLAGSATRGGKEAPGQGLEPQLTGSEPVVLPLHHPGNDAAPEVNSDRRN